jgi:hypothetical protein
VKERILEEQDFEEQIGRNRFWTDTFSMNTLGKTRLDEQIWRNRVSRNSVWIITLVKMLQLHRHQQHFHQRNYPNAVPRDSIPPNLFIQTSFSQGVHRKCVRPESVPANLFLEILFLQNPFLHIYSSKPVPHKLFFQIIPTPCQHQCNQYLIL